MSGMPDEVPESGVEDLERLHQLFPGHVLQEIPDCSFLRIRLSGPGDGQPRGLVSRSGELITPMVWPTIYGYGHSWGGGRGLYCYDSSSESGNASANLDLSGLGILKINQ